MTTKAMLKLTLATIFLGLTLFAIVAMNDTATPDQVHVAQPVADTNVDRNVRPATAEVDLMATALKSKKPSRVRTAHYEAASWPTQEDGVIRDSQVKLCQGSDCGCDTGVATAGYAQSMGYASQASYGQSGPQQMASRSMYAVDQTTRSRFLREPRWMNAKQRPFEQYSYGEYVGPFRTPHVPDYRIRIGDQLEFVYLLTRRRSNEPYRLFVGDTIQVTSTTDSTLNQPTVQILSDGTISLPLVGVVRAAGKTINNIQRELNDRYIEYVKNPEIVVQVIQGDTPLEDLRDAVDARQGTGGQSRNALVSPDGTIQLPMVGSVPAIGLTLDEIGREVNARYRLYFGGVEVTPILTQRAPRFIYVVGEVNQGGRFELTGPTSAMQAIALAGGFNDGGNLRQVVVFRRDANWQLIATRLDLGGALNGRRPYPSDEIWLRDSDIVLIPKKPIQRLSEAVNQYLTNTIYGIFPQQGIAFSFDNFESL
jgi:polysaccharide export outer membrane protein